MRRYINQYEWIPEMDPGEVISGKSLTVPDESYTIRELYDRFTRGQGIDSILKEGTYDEDLGDDDFDSISPLETALDITDVDDEVRYVKEFNKRAKQKKNEEKVVEPVNTLKDEKVIRVSEADS